MTRKDYVLAVSFIIQTYDPAIYGEKKGSAKRARAIAEKMKVVDMMSRMFYHDNLRFSAPKFQEACERTHIELQ